MAVVVDADYKKEIEKARRELRAIITRKNCASKMLRLAWHDAGTYNAEKKKGGANGATKKLTNLDSDLKDAIDLCEEVKKKHPKISYADLYQLAGILAVEMFGGPSIEFVPGRTDSQESPEEVSFQEADLGAKGLRKIFNRMGLNDQDIVALSRVYTLVRRTRADENVFVETQTREPLEIDNSYFVKLQKLKRSQATTTDPKEEELSTEKALIEDPEFYSYVDLYAKDEDAFVRDYAKSHKKLSELGFIQPSSAHKASASKPMKPSEQKSPSTSTGPKAPKVTTIGAVGIVIAATVVLLNYLYKGTK